MVGGPSKALTILAAWSFALPVCAQTGDLVQNGDFESGKLAPWIAGGSMWNPKVETTPRSMCHNRVKTLGFAADVASLGNVSISQTVNVPKGKLEIGFDLTVTVGAAFRVFGLYRVILGATDYGWQSFRDQRSAGGSTGFTFWDVKDHPVAGQQQLRIQFTYTEAGNLPSKVHLDNIVLRAHRTPLIQQAGCGLVMQNARMVGRATPGVLTLLHVSAKLLAQPVRIPPYSGNWRLDPAAGLFFVVARAPNSVGFVDYPLGNVPAILRGRSLAWQALEFDVPRRHFSFGYPVTLRFR